MKKMFLAMTLAVTAAIANAQVVIPSGMTTEQVAFLFAIGQITTPLPYTVSFPSVGCKIYETVFYTFTGGCGVVDFQAGPWASNAVFPLTE